MARTIVAAALQLAAHSRASFMHAWPDIAARIGAAAEAGANLVVLPEGTLPAYVLGYERYEAAEIDAALQECCELAKRLGIVVIAGAVRRDGDRVYNSAIVLDRDGSVAGAADKHFLWHFDRQWFAPGERIEPIRTSIGDIGALICADGRIPTISRALVDAGADVLVMPTAWVTSGRDPHNFENAQADLLARVRARENGVPFVAANKCGVEMECVAYCGKSQIVSGQGEVLALASQDRAETITASITIGESQPQRSHSAASAPHTGWNTPQRVAITHRARRAGDDALLRILEADTLIDADCAGFEDAAVLDPGALAALRLSTDLRVAVWRTSYDPPWQVTFARARALELRMYVIVIDAHHERAYAVDPDGTVVCGTFGGYEIASFAFDPARTAQTAVAPGTDVLEGLRRVQMHAR